MNALATRFILLTAFALALSPSMAAAIQLRGSVVGNGGTPPTGMTSPARRMLGTVGQPAIGLSFGASRTVCHGFWCFGGSRVVDVEPPAGGPNLPTELAFSQPRPNPSRDRVSFELALPKTADVSLALYDLQGRRVLTLVDGPIEAGYHVVRWDGADGSGSGGSGVYFARLLVGGRPFAQRRLVVIR